MTVVCLHFIPIPTFLLSQPGRTRHWTLQSLCSGPPSTSSPPSSRAGGLVPQIITTDICSRSPRNQSLTPPIPVASMSLIAAVDGPASEQDIKRMKPET